MTVLLHLLHHKQIHMPFILLSYGNEAKIFNSLLAGEKTGAYIG